MGQRAVTETSVSPGTLLGMAIRGLPRPLPECKGCGDPMARATHADQLGKCSDCQTPADRMAAEHRRQHLRRLASDSTGATNQRVDNRIASLAAKRQQREARTAGLIP